MTSVERGLGFWPPRPPNPLQWLHRAGSTPSRDSVTTNIHSRAPSRNPLPEASRAHTGSAKATGCRWQALSKHTSRRAPPGTSASSQSEGPRWAHNQVPCTQLNQAHHVPTGEPPGANVNEDSRAPGAAPQTLSAHLMLTVTLGTETVIVPISPMRKPRPGEVR